MIRRWSAVVLIAALALAGCVSPPSGLDGDLTDDWGAMPPPGVSEVVGACHEKPVSVLESLTEDGKVDCGTEHATETLFAGYFSGEVAAAAQPPSSLLGDSAPAYDTCEERTDSLVGGDWRDFRIRPALVLPSMGAWAAGERWFRCDVEDLAAFDGVAEPGEGHLTSRLASLRLTCFQGVKNESGGVPLKAAKCEDAHNVEYTGSFSAGSRQDYPESDESFAPLHERCEASLSQYLGLSVGEFMTRYRGLTAPVADKSRWNAGERGVRCFLWLGSTTWTGSAKGTRTKLPGFTE
jgi:hypothetical protein